MNKQLSIIVAVVAICVVCVLGLKLVNTLAKTDELVESGQELVDTAQPVADEAADKAVEAIANVDAGEVAGTLQEEANDTIKAGSARIQRWINQDKEQDDATLSEEVQP